jgi:hypothetical protein
VAKSKANHPQPRGDDDAASHRPTRMALARVKSPRQIHLAAIWLLTNDSRAIHMSFVHKALARHAA